MVGNTQVIGRPSSEQIITYPKIQLRVHDRFMKTVDFINNDVPGSLKFHSDSFTQYLAQGSSEFKFTIDKFINGKLNEDRLKNITDDAYISFNYKGISYTFNIMKLTETDTSITVECEDLNLELLSEKVNSYKSEAQMDFATYCEVMGLFTYSKIELGINELTDSKRTLEFTSEEDTLLKRILDLVSRFDGECRFRTVHYNDGSVRSIILDVFKEQNIDKKISGVGRDRKDVRLRMGRDVVSVKKTSDKNVLFNAVRVRNKDGQYIKQPKAKEVKAADGKHIEFFTTRNSTTVYAPIAMDKYPSVTKRNNCDNWIVRDVKTEYTTPEEAWMYSIRMLKLHAYPQVEYDVELNGNQILLQYDLSIGDTVYIQDDNYIGGLTFRARITEMLTSFSDPTSTSIKLSSVTVIKSQIQSSLTTLMSQMISDAEPYKILVKTTNGTALNELNSTTTLIATLYKGNRDVTDTAEFRYYNEENLLGLGDRLEVNSGNVGTNGIATITLQAYVGDKKVDTQQITINTINDGVSPIHTVIESSAGNIFRNGVLTTTLKVRLYRNDEEIDTEGRAFKYIWSKRLQNGSPDESWNRNHQLSTKTLQLNSADVYQKAVFNCEIQTIE